MKNMVTVGSSTDSAGSASTAEVSQMVSEMFSSPRPVIAMMSPASARVDSIRSRPMWPSTLPTLPLRVLPSLSMMVTCWFGFTLPRLIRPIPITPR
ncbi:hypothetical protein D3C76_1464990 [compost metagenome]